MLKRLAVLVALLTTLPSMSGQTVKSKDVAPTPIVSKAEHPPTKLTRLPSVTITQKENTFEGVLLAWGPWVFSLLLAIVGLLQVRILRRQTSIQEATIKQWVYVKLASVTNKQFSTKSPAETDPTILTQVHFEAYNNTPLPLTIKRVVTSITGASELPNWLTYSVEETTILPPKTPDYTINYPFYVPHTLTGIFARRYLEGESYFTVSGSLSFEEASGKRSTQGFSYVVKHGPQGFTVLKYNGKQPTRQDGDVPN